MNNGSAKLLERLLAGQLLGLVGEAIPGRLLFDENLQVEIPRLIAIQQAYRNRIVVLVLEPVIQVRATTAAKPRWAHSDEL